jgi:hypothetical protein
VISITTGTPSFHIGRHMELKGNRAIGEVFRFFHKPSSILEFLAR